MKKLYTILTLLALVAGSHQKTYTMDAAEEMPQDKRPPIGTHTQAQAWKVALREMIQALPEYCSTPLYYPIYCEHELKNITAFIQATLLDPGSEISDLIAKKEIGQVLYKAAKEANHQAALKWLIREKLVNYVLEFRRALEQSKYDEAEFWLHHGATVNDKNQWGNTVLHTYSNYWDRRERIEQIKWLLTHDVNVNAQDRDGNTPLHYAVSNTAIEKIKLLLDHEAQTNIKNEKGETVRDFYFMLNADARRQLDDAGITQRLGIKDTDEK